MKNHFYFSIIMPLYNCADLTEQIVSKLNEQTCKDFEVLFVNDGSKDNTQQALLTALENASFSYRTLEQENAGPGAARNNGIANAVGKYLLFLDADDYFEENAIETLKVYAQKNDADVLLFGYYQDFYIQQDRISHSVTVVPEAALLEGTAAIIKNAALLDGKKVFSFAWNKAIKTALVQRHMLRFSDRKHSEDYFFYTEIFSHIERLCIIDAPLYHYIKTPRETLTNQPYLKNYYALISERYTSMRNMLKNAGVYEGEAAAVAANVHIKHIFSHFSNNCAKESGMNGRAIRRDICKTLQDEPTLEALRLADARSRADKIMIALLRTRSAMFCHLFALAVYKMKNNKLFNKLK